MDGKREGECVGEWVRIFSWMSMHVNTIAWMENTHWFFLFPAHKNQYVRACANVLYPGIHPTSSKLEGSFQDLCPAPFFAIQPITSEKQGTPEKRTNHRMPCSWRHSGRGDYVIVVVNTTLETERIRLIITYLFFLLWIIGMRSCQSPYTHYFMYLFWFLLLSLFHFFCTSLSKLNALCFSNFLFPLFYFSL